MLYKKHYWVVAIIATTLLSAFSYQQHPTRLQKKTTAAIVQTFDIEDYDTKNLNFSASENNETPAELKQSNLSEILQNKALIGYIYKGKANSMKNTFDYVILFNPDFSIRKAKVLIYREKHGLQIGSQRWLKQFIGFDHNSNPDYGKNIDAITGATISATSMTKAVANVLKSINILKTKNKLP